MDEATVRIDKSRRVEVCYPDVQKAFEFVNHIHLYQKSEAFGLDAKVKNWITKFRKGRPFRMSVEKCLSDGGLLYTGVP